MDNDTTQKMTKCQLFVINANCRIEQLLESGGLAAVDSAEPWCWAEVSGFEILSDDGENSLWSCDRNGNPDTTMMWWDNSNREWTLGYCDEEED